ncbi:hypothetical protein ACSZNY_17445, partial [Aeromonas caviae]
RGAGMKVCSGGIVGMGEQAKDRAGLLMALANLPVLLCCCAAVLLCCCAAVLLCLCRHGIPGRKPG